MRPVEPRSRQGARLVLFAKDQPQYMPLPASVDANGLVMTEWEPTAEELEALLTGGRIRIWVHTFNHPLQPLSVDVVAPDGGLRDES
jgi:hypothetical protein